MILPLPGENLLVLSREWLGMGEWDYCRYCGSFPNSLLLAPESIKLTRFDHHIEDAHNNVEDMVDK